MQLSAPRPLTGLGALPGKERWEGQKREKKGREKVVRLRMGRNKGWGKSKRMEVEGNGKEGK